MTFFTVLSKTGEGAIQKINLRFGIAIVFDTDDPNFCPLLDKISMKPRIRDSINTHDCIQMPSLMVLIILCKRQTLVLNITSAVQYSETSTSNEIAMQTTYEFRYVKAQWGVFIDLTAEAVPFDNKIYPGVTSITDSLKVLYVFRKSTALHPIEKEYIEKGLKYVTAKIENSQKSAPPILVRVTGMWTNDCDYQEEGFMFAIIGWAAQYFDFEMPTIEGSYDRSKNRYMFWMDGQRVASVSRHGR